jgi:hypothetical protein
MKRQPRTQGARSGRDRGILASSPGAPTEGSDAGSDADLRAHYRDKRIRQLRARAKRHWQNACRLSGQGAAVAEPEARTGIDAAVRAFWWAEDTDAEDSLHQLMHDVGRWTRRTFGCHLAYNGTRYTHRCPIAIAHKRLGMSMAFVARRICSVCGQDLSECPHIRGRAYWVRGGPHNGVECPVCMRWECEHRSDRLYRASVISIVKHVDRIREISLVGRPAQPEARLTELPIDTDDLRSHLGPAFHLGMEVSCDLCLGQCWGFDDFPERWAS